MRTTYTPAQNLPVIHAHTIYVGDLTRRVGLLVTGGRPPSLPRLSKRPPVPLPVEHVSSELFEDR